MQIDYRAGKYKQLQHPLENNVQVSALKDGIFALYLRCPARPAML